MTRVAVLGAGGFVGASLLESFALREATEVRAIVRSYRSMASFCRLGPAVEVRLADAEDSAALAKVLAGVDAVVNVTTGPPAGIVKSTKSIYSACAAAGVKRFIHLSSAVVYGDVESKDILDDSPPLAKHWMPYARAKGASEVWLRERLQCNGPDIIVLRPGIVWGVHSSHTIDLARAMARKDLFLVNGGRGIFNGIYIANLVASISACCGHDGRAVGFYNVGDEVTVTWREFIAALGSPMGLDVTQLADISGDLFPWSLRARIDYVQMLPLVNEFYHRLKMCVPDSIKSTIRNRLEGAYRYERFSREYTSRPGVDRELWHLQRVRYKLPTDKFAKTFGYSPPVPFSDGIRRTTDWLSTLGYGLSASNLPRPAVANS